MEKVKSEGRQSLERLAAKIKKDVPKEGIVSAGGVNSMLIAGYRAETGQHDFRSFKHWREAGYQVRKGSKGFPIFSRPIGAIKEERGKEASADDFKFFGTCYLFHRGQVEVKGGGS